MEFDFDAWARLAKDDPEAFERQREATLRATIAAAPEAHRERLERLQYRLDLERQQAKTTLAACVRLNSLMWTGFRRLRKELQTVSRGFAEEAPRTSAKVISLASHRRYRKQGSSGGGES